MSLAVSGRRPVLADLIARPSDRARALALDAGLVVAGAAIVAVLAQVEVPLQPVPITGQTLGVVVVGAALGARRGAAALLTYMLAGLAGLPVFGLLNSEYIVYQNGNCPLCASGSQAEPASY